MMQHARKRSTHLVTILVFLAPQFSAASDAVSSAYGTIPESRASASADTYGFGQLVGTAGKSLDLAFVVEAQNHFKQRRTLMRTVRYGFAQARLEAGTGLGFALASTSGFTLMGASVAQPIALHIGVEPLHGRIQANTNDVRRDFAEWTPTIGIGPQFFTSNCRMLPVLARVGGAAGNVARADSWSPELGAAAGVGSYLACSSWDLAAEWLRVAGPSGPVDWTMVSISGDLPSDGLRWGVQVEALAPRLQTNREEARLSLLIRNRW